MMKGAESGLVSFFHVIMIIFFKEFVDGWTDGTCTCVTSVCSTYGRHSGRVRTARPDAPGRPRMEWVELG